MRERLQARTTFTARIVFVVDLERELVETATIEIDSLEHVSTLLTFKPLEGVDRHLERLARRTVERNPVAALAKLIHE
ncbi:MAG: hypothetical protein H0W90_07075 [Actinobacteria bacterium]|nr:hypothetical protein [Actinomycetota bacterium]